IIYYTTDSWRVGTDDYDFYLHAKARETSFFKTGVSVYTSSSSSYYRTNTYTKTTKRMPDAFMTNGSQIPYISKLEA
ncbi:MAG: hypothetical protein ACK521_07425, partial [bacterium]